MFLEGAGTDPDPAQAVDWLLTAAKNENADAQLKLGQLHREGEHLPYDDF